MFPTAILLLIFNRPETTLRVFEQVRHARPARLYIAADGPRPDHPSDQKNCEQTRIGILKQIDWPCEVKTLFRTTNLGCGRSVSEAISWFFEQEEQGIILEDDCLPDPSFFVFCEQALERYKEVSQVMHISGNNFQQEQTLLNESGYFSKYPDSWGWATWRRAWEKFDFKLENGSAEGMQQTIANRSFHKGEERYWMEAYLQIKDGAWSHIWDTQWTLTIWANQGLALLPAVNLITNIGFGETATHTKQADSFLVRQRATLSVPFCFPAKLSADEAKDRYKYRHTFGKWRTPNRFEKAWGFVFWYIKKIMLLTTRWKKGSK